MKGCTMFVLWQKPFEAEQIEEHESISIIHRKLELINSQRLTIRPATLRDKRKVYDWLTHSNLTSEMLGPPDYPDAPIPTWEDFNQDFLDHYFDNSKPLKGHCFILVYKGLEVGQINYNPIDLNTNSTEIDIWLADKKYVGQGFGTEAIKWLCSYLDEQFNCKTIYIAPSRRNLNAIRAYKKLGFKVTEKLPDNFVPDYEDTIVLKREV